MEKLEQLIKQLKDLKEELAKGANVSPAPMQNTSGSGVVKTEKLSTAKNGQWSLDKVE